MPINASIKSLYNQQNFVRILIFSVVTVMIWIGFSIFRTQQTTQISAELQQMSLPLNPTINMDLINRIDAKKTYTDQELSLFPIYALTADRTGADTIAVINGVAPAQPVSIINASTGATNLPAAAPTTSTVILPAIPATPSAKSATQTGTAATQSAAILPK